MKDSEAEQLEKEITELAEWLNSLKFHEAKILKAYYETLPAFDTESDELNVHH